MRLRKAPQYQRALLRRGHGGRTEFVEQVELGQQVAAPPRQHTQRARHLEDGGHVAHKRDNS